jgi:hypothetical protein
MYGVDSNALLHMHMVAGFVHSVNHLTGGALKARQFEVCFFGYLRVMAGIDDMHKLGVTDIDDGAFCDCPICSKTRGSGATFGAFDQHHQHHQNHAFARPAAPCTSTMHYASEYPTAPCTTHPNTQQRHAPRIRIPYSTMHHASEYPTTP